MMYLGAFPVRMVPVSILCVEYSSDNPAISTPFAGVIFGTGSISFVPPVAGLVIAGEIIRDICGLA